MEGYNGNVGHPRPCGCKGVRTCLVCETEFGAIKRDFVSNEDCHSYVYCALCQKAWKGKDRDMWKEHPDHQGDPYDIPGIFIELNFVTPEEQKQLLSSMDQLPWDPSQSGRRKQNYGPKCNFKKRRMKPGDFNGFPKFSEFIQKRFQNVSLLEGFKTVEQCSLEYISERGASIDPHIDDCWVWGERVVTVNVIGDSMLTLNRYMGTHERYNLADVATYPRVLCDNGLVNPLLTDLGKGSDTARKKDDVKEPNTIDHAQDNDTCTEDGYLVTKSCPGQFFGDNLTKGDDQNRKLDHKVGNYHQDDSKSVPRCFNSYNFSGKFEGNGSFPIIRVPMPARSLLIIYGAARYEWEHSVLREDITGRRVCLAYREFTPPFLKGGLKEELGAQVLEKAVNFW